MGEINQNIDGVIVQEILTNTDARGWLCEIYRNDEQDTAVAMSYTSHTNYGFVRGPHEHRHQTDFFVFIGYGNFELYLWDNRKDSKTYGNKMKLVVGECNKISIIVPPGVVHGYKSISKGGSLSINLPDKLYRGTGKKEEADEIKHEDNHNSKFKIT